MVMITMPCDAKNGPHSRIELWRAVKPGHITNDANGGSASVGKNTVPPPYSRPPSGPNVSTPTGPPLVAVVSFTPSSWHRQSPPSQHAPASRAELPSPSVTSSGGTPPAMDESPQAAPASDQAPNTRADLR